MREEKTLGRIVALNVLFMMELAGGDVDTSFRIFIFSSFKS